MDTFWIAVVSFAENNPVEWTIKFDVYFHRILFAFHVDCLQGTNVQSNEFID